MSSVITSLVLSAGIVIATCFFGYLPQAALLTVVLGPFGFLVAVVAVIVESWLFVKIFVGSFLIKGMIGEDIFEVVLQQRSSGAILNIKSKTPGLGSLDVADRATKAFQQFQPGALTQYFLTLPLAFIPVIGWALFIYLNARKTAKSYVQPYLKRGRGLQGRAEQVIEEHEAEFNSFGAVALGLEQIPIVGAVFQITNFVGAALWVEKLDAKRQMGELTS